MIKPVISVYLISLLIALAGFSMAWQETGEFCYALDDSFIMMALAKNLAFHQVWGLTPHHFSSTASSPLFAIILAGADILFGEHIWMPLIINLAALLGLYFFTAFLCRRWQFRPWQTGVMLMGLFILIPVPVLLFGSMEHILHTLIAFACLALALEFEKHFSYWYFLMAGVLLVSIRFEGLFEGGLLLLWLWKEKKWLKGLFLGLGMLIPLCWLGFYSLSQGWFFLPNSLVLKAYGMNVQETGSFTGFLLSWISKAANYPHCMAAMLTLWMLRDLRASRIHQNQAWLGIVLLTSIAHFVLARYGHVYRYEGYLMALAWLVIWKIMVQSGVFSAGFSIRSWIYENRLQAFLYFLLAFSPLYRSVESFLNGSKAIVNIFEQQVQTARFVRSYYNEAIVGAIDVGAIAYYSDCKLQDLWGLGTMDFALLKLQNRYRSAEIDSVCRNLGVSMAIGYGNPIKEPGWEKVESWAIQDNRVCARDTIDFYALNPKSLQNLKRNLIDFHKQLPASVIIIPGKESVN